MSLRSTEAPTLIAPAQQRTADPLAALRQATQERHARLDAHLPIARPDANMQDYVQHARALSGWLTALAPELQALQAQQTQARGFTFDDPARLAALTADLHDAGMAGTCAAMSIATLDAMNQALQTVPTQHTAFRWGLAYVVEGSQLGGQVLHRRLATRLAPHPLRYLQGSGGGATGARWREFVERLRDQVRTPDAVQAACAGAGAAFDGLERELRAAGASL